MSYITYLYLNISYIFKILDTHHISSPSVSWRLRFLFYLTHLEGWESSPETNSGPEIKDLHSMVAKVVVD